MGRHVSALALDALALGALDQAETTQVRTHLAGCSTCRADQDAAAALRAEFATRVLPRGLPVRRPRRWPWLVFPAIAAAAVTLTLWLAPRPRIAPDSDLAIKGGASWQVFAHRAGQTFPVHDGTPLAAGDRIRFVVVPEQATYLIVASVDGSGAITVYYPYGGDHSVAIEGDRVELAGSIELDDAPGPERIYALLSDRPIAAETVKSRLRAVAAGGAAAIRGTETLELPVRAELSLVFEKLAPGTGR
jgi:putative zinc finger protein